MVHKTHSMTLRQVSTSILLPSNVVRVRYAVCKNCAPLSAYILYVAEAVVAFL